MADKTKTKVAPAPNVEQSANGNTETTVTTPKRSKEEIQKDIDDAKAKQKALKAELKGEKPKKEKGELKGKMITFLNKAQQRITGLGNLYYVVRANGRLNYKAADAVVFLPEGWKEGDALPEEALKQEATEDITA